jgi:WhiB family transcriptional regulator, redox-sensing transcriptional regulator
MIVREVHMPLRIDEWKKRAACKKAPTEIFVLPDEVDEPFYPPREAVAYCNVCPVKTECLQYALERNEVGVWGGTSSYQRRQMGQEHDRIKCPGCASTLLIRENNVQLCLACGVSWPII